MTTSPRTEYSSARRGGTAACLAIFMALALSACVAGPGPDRSAGRATPPGGIYAPEHAPPAKPGKVGRPYSINGVWYTPAAAPDYDETGIASWYGPKYHGRPTATGETYDMNGMTAAHTTLPLPSRVRVTNLENGASLTLTVNDRGPFVGDRIIDVSRAAAERLGFRHQGMARVRVQVIGARATVAAMGIDAADRSYAEPAAQRGLESLRAGTASNWRNPGNGNTGTFTPVRTWRTAQGNWCRDFRHSVTIQGATRHGNGTACRRGAGHWSVMR